MRQNNFKTRFGACLYKRGLIALCACLLFFLSGCGSREETAVQSGEDLPVITVGCDDYPPFSYVDMDGNLTGIDIDLAREAFGRMGYRPEFIVINWEDKKELLHSGAVDCLWSSFTMDGREEEYQWAGPYAQSRQVVAVNPDSAIHSLQDLEDKVIAVQSSTKPEDIIRSHDGTLPELHKMISVQKRDLIFILLSKGYVDALAAHDTAVEQFMAETGLKFRILDEPLLEVGLGVAFDQDDTRGLHAELTEVLNEMSADGTTERIFSSYSLHADRQQGGSDET